MANNQIKNQLDDVNSVITNIVVVIKLYIYYLTQRAINLLSLLTEPKIKIKTIDQCALIHHNIKEKFYQNVLQTIHLDLDNIDVIVQELSSLMKNNQSNQKSLFRLQSKANQRVKEVISDNREPIEKLLELDIVSENQLETINKEILKIYQDPTSQLRMMIDNLNDLLDTCENSISNFYNNRVNRQILTISLASLLLAIISIIVSFVTF